MEKKGRGKLLFTGVICGILISALAVVGFLGFSGYGIINQKGAEEYKYLKETYGFAEGLKKLLEEQYYQEIEDQEALLDGMYKGLVDGLGDPYSEYLTEEEFEKLYNDVQGNYGGVGVTMSANEDNFIEVISVTDKSPAQKAGIRPGDLIVAVNDVTYLGEQMSEAAENIRGEEGTKVTLTIMRDDEMSTFTLKREKLTDITVYTDVLENNIGYIQISAFEMNTGKDFAKELQKLEDKNVRGLIIDLRNNGGGVVSSAIEVADQLMDAGTVIYAENRQGERTYYKTENGNKWYLESFSNEDIQVQPALQTDGTILYEPVLFTPDGMPGNDVLTMQNSEGETRTESVIWKVTAPLGEIYEPDYRYLEENNIAYVSMRQFNEMEDGPLYKDFMQTGRKAQNCELVIFDLRSNSGGNGESMYSWIKNFTKTSPQLTEARAQRNSAFFGRNPKSNYSAFSKPNIFSGKWISNDIPVIVLVDDYCASAGERALNLLTTMDNVLVVGSNTDGCQLGGNNFSICLPNSGIRCYIGTELCFVNDMTNLDCIGYTPDIWCNPATAMESVLNMLKQYELASEETVSVLYEQLDGTAMNRNNITLQFLDFVVPPYSGFGTDELGIHYAAVLADGEQTTDFTVESLNPDICVCEKIEDGRIQIQTTGTGFGPICVTVGKTTAEFTWVCMP